jgi:hypothetical protein
MKPSKRFPHGCYAQQRFELAASDCYELGQGHTVWGDGGAEVMRVIKPNRKGPGGVWFLNSDTGDGFGGAFKYRDFFPVNCPHGMPLAENVCGPCSQGRPNRKSH